MNTCQIVDEIQLIKQQIAALEMRLDPLVETLKSSGVGVYEGSVADVSITERKTDRTDWKSIVEKYAIPKRVITRATKTITTKVCNIVAKHIEQKAA